MLKPALVFVVALLLLVPLTGCGGDDDDNDEREQTGQPVDGTFVGQLSGADGLIAVVAAPAAKGQDERELTAYVSDGARVSEWFRGSITDNSFTAASDDDDAEAKGDVAGDSIEGTIELPGGKSARYEAARAIGAAGLYELTVSGGKLTGASAAGVGLKSNSELRAPGTGKLRFADGNRRMFEVTVASDGDRGRIRSGQVRLIVLPQGRMSGAGARQPGAPAEFFIKSTGK